ncbi:hypothetical protein F8M41_000442 [Gigaspora margarita]|uniref:C2H2-type domain-containing protein n=1 Tax=Gigaspora margarita TaxID=4874 RepID=A0A8H3XG58_GIGMA|nr:hypothetical protein F8M41_000442 [Gigaspora margarita]
MTPSRRKHCDGVKCWVCNQYFKDSKTLQAHYRNIHQTTQSQINYTCLERTITKCKEEIAKNNYIIRQLNVQNENLRKDALKLRKENKTLKEENNAFKKKVANDYYLNQYEIAQNEIIELIQEKDILIREAEAKDKEIFLLQDQISNLTISNGKIELELTPLSGLIYLDIYYVM